GRAVAATRGEGARHNRRALFIVCRAYASARGWTSAPVMPKYRHLLLNAPVIFLLTLPTFGRTIRPNRLSEELFPTVRKCSSTLRRQFTEPRSGPNPRGKSN